PRKTRLSFLSVHESSGSWSKLRTSGSVSGERLGFRGKGMLIDPISSAGRTAQPEIREDAALRGRRKFGDACLASGQRAVRAANPNFLMTGPDGVAACQILLLPGFELNELAALTEAFDRANRVLRQGRFGWQLASLDGAPIRSANGLPVAVA